MTEEVSRHVAELAERGFTVLPAHLPGAATQGLVDDAERAWRRAGEPPLHAEQDLPLGPGVETTAVGFTLRRALEHGTSMLPFLLDPAVRAIVAACLGPSAVLEQASMVMSDEHRPFFFWHHHLGGIDAVHERGRVGPGPLQHRRLVCTLYGCDLDAANGRMLVSPRALGETTAPPFPPGREPWPDSIALEGRAGTVVILDEACWHAVEPMARPGRRVFAAFFVRRREVGAQARDPSIVPAQHAHPALGAAYGAP